MFRWSCHMKIYLNWQHQTQSESMICYILYAQQGFRETSTLNALCQQDECMFE